MSSRITLDVLTERSTYTSNGKHKNKPQIRQAARCAAGDFAAVVIAGLTGNAAFPSPPATTANLTSLKTAFDNAIVAAAQGGSMDVAAKNNAGVALLAGLGKDASYVDISCNSDLSVLLSSGYEAVSTNGARTMLDAPQVRSVDPVQTGQLKVRVAGDANRRSLLGRIKAVNGSEFGPSISFASSREILFDGLTSSMKYIIQLCGIGGSTGQSDWAETGPNMAL